MRTIKFYTKEGCSLCKEVRKIIDNLSREYEIDVEVVDILKSAAAWEKYRYLIPVVVIDENVEFHGSVEEREIRELLRAK